MKDNILIKGNKYGFKIVIDNDSNLEDAYEELKTKLLAGRKFFGNGEVSLEIKYDKLNEKIQRDILKIVRENSDLKVFCLVDENMATVDVSEFKAKKKSTKIKKNEKKNDSNIVLNKGASDVEYAKFFQGTLRSGQELKSDKSIVFLGDVNPGARILSTGNIIVLGKIKGFAHAGATGNKNAAIFAVSLQPTQLRIAEFIARAPESYEGSVPSVAFVEDERITIDNIDKGLLKDFVLLK